MSDPFTQDGAMSDPFGKDGAMSDPFGKDGALTRIGEKIPGVNNIVQALHKRAGHGDALDRARNSNPVGVNGNLTKVGEHIPGLSRIIQKRHRKRGKEEALERATLRDPFNRDGYLTRAAEYTPGVNLVVQEMHRRKGNNDALKRARENNPVGAHGVITKTLENVPVVADFVAMLHRMAHQHEALDRTKLRTFQSMLGKDGLVTKTMELLPGTNVVAACLHEAAGNSVEADRALNLVNSWKRAASANGPLTKIAELIPGVDVVAFVAHMNLENYPQALRSVTKTHYVSIKGSFEFTLCVQSLYHLQILSLIVEELEVRPRAYSMVGALMDLTFNFLGMDRSGARRRERRLRLQRRGLKYRQDSSSKKNAKESMRSAINDVVANIVDRQIDLLEVNLALAVNIWDEMISKARCSNKLYSLCLPPRLPNPHEELVVALQNAVFRTTFDRLLLDLDVPKLRQRSPTCFTADNETFSKCAGTISCSSCFGYVALGCGTKFALLACCAGIVSAGSKLWKYGVDHAADRLNRWNAEMWSRTLSGGMSACSSTSSQGNSETDEKISAVVAEVAPADLPELEHEILRYVSRSWLHVRRFWITPAMLRNLASSARYLAVKLLEVSETPIPAVFEATVKPQKIVVVDEKLTDPFLELSLNLPEFNLGVLLDVRRSSKGRLLEGIRVVITDSEIVKLVTAVKPQIERWDLRGADPRLKGFTAPVNVTFDLNVLDNASTAYSQLTISNFNVRLHLPH